MATTRSLHEFAATVLTRDGSVVNLRPIRPNDEDRLIALFDRLSPHTIYLRFHHLLTQLSREEAKRYSSVDYHDSFALVARLGEDEEERIIGVARYYRLANTDSAELAIVVEDAYQNRGIGTHLLEQLAAIARQNDIRQFQAEVLTENEGMMQVLLDSGFKFDQELDYHVYRVVLPLAPTPAFEQRTAERERIATIASLNAFLKPRSVAVIGATQRPGSIGNKLFRNLLHQGLEGIVYPVNPKTDVVASVRAYPTVLDIPGDVDLAVVIVPAQAVPGVVQQCGRKGVRGVVVISAGFAETGAEGAALQREIAQIARDHGLRLVGPNCMGIINTDPKVNMNATFSSVFPPAGNIAFLTQSGALGLAILEYAQLLNIGLSHFISIGNKADVSGNDFLQYWAQDVNTEVILLYLESFGNPRKFSRIARDTARVKPVVAVKSGRTAVGSRAAASHTGALASADVASQALFDQAGVIRVDTLEELFDVANLLSHQPLPHGRRLAILTNGGGPGIMTADACAERGLELPILSQATVSQLKEFLPAAASLSNPIDMTAGATADQYHRALEVLVDDADLDSVVVIFIPPIIAAHDAAAAAIRAVAPRYRERGKTLLASFMGSRGATIDLSSDNGNCVPSFAFPEATAEALAKACQRSEWLKKPRGTIPTLEGIDSDRAAKLIDSAMASRKTRPLWLDPSSITELLHCYGIRTPQAENAATASDAANAASRMGFPVALKLLSDSITHKTEVGGVVLDLRTKADIERAFAQIRDRLAEIGRDSEMQGVTVQEMVSEGVEVIVGVSEDRTFGPLIVFGTGGVYAELFKDVTFRIHPLTDVDAAEMVRSVKAYQLLDGWRGSPPSDVQALEDLLLRASAMIEDLPQISEMDLNPVKVQKRGEGYVVVDARIMVTQG